MAKVAFLASLHSAAPARAAPYPRSRVAGRRVTMGMVAAVLPVASRVRASTAYLKVKGTCRKDREIAAVIIEWGSIPI